MAASKLSCYSIWALIAVASAEGSSAQCDVDLTTKGLPICFQDCADWCWATVVGEFDTYYNKRGLGASKNYCPQEECAVVSEAVGKKCCAHLGKPGRACGGASKEGTCGGPAKGSTIIGELRKRIPQRSWTLVNRALSETELQNALRSGHPVGRNLPGHIDAVVGCRPKGSGTEYKVIDSLGGGGGDPDKAFWWSSYDVAVYNGGSKPAWLFSYYSKSASYTNVTIV